MGQFIDAEDMLIVHYAAQNGIGCEGGKAIAKGRWPKLQSLDLSTNKSTQK